VHPGTGLRLDSVLAGGDGERITARRRAGGSAPKGIRTPDLHLERVAS
jgi:hypothetical protein